MRRFSTFILIWSLAFPAVLLAAHPLVAQKGSNEVAIQGDLQSIEQAVTDYADHNKKLPENLDALKLSGSITTRAALYNYSFRPLPSAGTYEICADFPSAANGGDTQEPGDIIGAAFDNHPKGHKCFTGTDKALVLLSQAKSGGLLVCDSNIDPTTTDANHVKETKKSIIQTIAKDKGINSYELTLSTDQDTSHMLCPDIVIEDLSQKLIKPSDLKSGDFIQYSANSDGDLLKISLLDETKLTPLMKLCYDPNVDHSDSGEYKNVTFISVDTTQQWIKFTSPVAPHPIQVGWCDTITILKNGKQVIPTSLKPGDVLTFEIKGDYHDASELSQ